MSSIGAQRIVRLQSGLLGDVKPVGDGVSELRVDYGPGDRMYFVQRGKILIVLLCGGDKRTQASDIGTAKALRGDGNLIRVISARTMHRKERKRYEQAS